MALIGLASPGLLPLHLVNSQGLVESFQRRLPLIRENKLFSKAEISLFLLKLKIFLMCIRHGLGGRPLHFVTIHVDWHILSLWFYLPVWVYDSGSGI